MASVRHEILIDASPQHVWDVIRDVAPVHERLLPGRVAATRIDGVQRFLTFPDGHVIRELIITIDDRSRRLAYAVVEGARPPLDLPPCRFRGTRRGWAGRLIWLTDVLPDTAAPEIRIRTEFGLTEMKQTIEASAPHRGRSAVAADNNSGSADK